MMDAVLPARFLPIISIERVQPQCLASVPPLSSLLLPYPWLTVQSQRAYIQTLDNQTLCDSLRQAACSSVVTAAIALLTNSSFTPSGWTRNTTTSSLTVSTVPRIPPLVVTRSPVFN